MRAYFYAKGPRRHDGGPAACRQLGCQEAAHDKSEDADSQKTITCDMHPESLLARQPIGFPPIKYGRCDAQHRRHRPGRQHYPPERGFPLCGRQQQPPPATTCVGIRAVADRYGPSEPE
jgi:hypothetical protein